MIPLAPTKQSKEIPPTREKTTDKIVCDTKFRHVVGIT